MKKSSFLLFLLGLSLKTLAINYYVSPFGNDNDTGESSTNPTETLNNYYTQWVNRRHLRRPEVGGSDSHFRSAVGRAATAFPGRTSDDLFAAIRSGSTRAVGEVYGPFAVLEYLRDRIQWKKFCGNHPIHRVYNAW